jgi:hypothetical protein
MKTKTATWWIALATAFASVAEAQAPVVSPRRDVRGYQPPIAPPLVSTFCGRRRECARDGRCTQVGEDCVATSMEVCAFSEGCRDEGRCFLDPEAQRCEDGRRRASPSAIPLGATLLALGGAAFAAGFLYTVLNTLGPALDYSGGSSRSSPDIGPGIGLIVAGSAVALGAGLPILLVGRKKEWRPGLVVGAPLAPMGAALEVSF